MDGNVMSYIMMIKYLTNNLVMILKDMHRWKCLAYIGWYLDRIRPTDDGMENVLVFDEYLYDTNMCPLDDGFVLTWKDVT